MKQGAVYILFNERNGTLYTGVSSDLVKRISEHRLKTNPSCFTARYNVFKLGYYEVFDALEAAILREKQIKAGSRKKKLALIESFNPDWQDLYEAII